MNDSIHDIVATTPLSTIYIEPKGFVYPSSNRTRHDGAAAAAATVDSPLEVSAVQPLQSPPSPPYT